MTRPTRTTESGSMFILILVAIAMFAAISYAVLEGGKGGISNLSREQSRVVAQEIIDYGDQIARAVAALRLRGCMETEISMASHNGNAVRVNAVPYDLSNGASPTDGSCDVFSYNGGKITPKKLDSGFISSTGLIATSLAPDSFVPVTIRMEGVGDESKAELVLWVGRLQPQVCTQINEILGVSNNDGDPPVDTFDCNTTFFQGTYDTGCSNVLGNGTPKLRGYSSYCSATDTSGETNSYFKTLIAR